MSNSFSNKSNITYSNNKKVCLWVVGTDNLEININSNIINSLDNLTFYNSTNHIKINNLNQNLTSSGFLLTYFSSSNFNSSSFLINWKSNNIQNNIFLTYYNSIGNHKVSNGFYYFISPGIYNNIIEFESFNKLRIIIPSHHSIFIHNKFDWFGLVYENNNNFLGHLGNSTFNYSVIFGETSGNILILRNNINSLFNLFISTATIYLTQTPFLFSNEFICKQIAITNDINTIFSIRNKNLRNYTYEINTDICYWYVSYHDVEYNILIDTEPYYDILSIFPTWNSFNQNNWYLINPLSGIKSFQFNSKSSLFLFHSDEIIISKYVIINSTITKFNNNIEFINNFITNINITNKTKILSSTGSKIIMIDDDDNNDDDEDYDNNSSNKFFFITISIIIFIIFLNLIIFFFISSVENSEIKEKSSSSSIEQNSDGFINLKDYLPNQNIENDK